MMKSVRWAVTGLAVAFTAPAFAAGPPDCSQIKQSAVEEVLGVTLPSDAFPLPSSPGLVNQVISANSEAVAGVILRNVNQAARAAGLDTGATMQQFLAGCGIGSGADNGHGNPHK